MVHRAHGLLDGGVKSWQRRVYIFICLQALLFESVVGKKKDDGERSSRKNEL